MTHCLRMSEQISIPTSEQFVQELDMELRWYELGLFLPVLLNREESHKYQNHAPLAAGKQQGEGLKVV